MAMLSRTLRALTLRSSSHLSLGGRLVSTEPRPQTQLVEQKQRTDVEVIPAKELPQTDCLSGIPEEQTQRVARIFVPARNAMQSGSYNTLQWKLEFENEERWENPLMGWTSSADPLSNMTLTFNSKEEAIAFAVRSGWKYDLIEPSRPRLRSKSYGENFSWNKKTRVSTK